MCVNDLLRFVYVLPVHVCLCLEAHLHTPILDVSFCYHHPWWNYLDTKLLQPKFGARKLLAPKRHFPLDAILGPPGIALVFGLNEVGSVV